jgi:hypothetical protein
MASAVQSRPNHYELLGLTPAATEAEISRAFAREIARPRAFGAIAFLSIAYETLRDAAKRKAYDASIGVGAKPPVADAPATWRNGNQLFASAAVPTPAVARPKHDQLPTASAVPQGLERNAVAEPRTASFIAASLRPEDPPEPQAIPDVRPTPSLDDLVLVDDAEDRSNGLMRFGIVAGGLVCAAVVIGALVGSNAGAGEQAAAAEPAVTAALPPAQPAKAAAAIATPAAPGFVEEQDRRVRIAVPAAPAKRPSIQPAMPVAEAGAATEAAVPDALAPLASAEPETAATAAAMPLPSAVIARTIHRIGYPCGQVAATSAVDGSPGVFNVACSSGQSYRATPIRGRYHFRRVSGR